MAIINFPYNKTMPKEFTCVLCRRIMPLSDATIGPLKAGGEASLLCNDHLWDGPEFIDSLADYMAGERQRLLDAKDHDLMQLGAPHVRTLH